MNDIEIELENEKRLAEINTQIEEYLGKDVKAIYSAYDYDENSLIVNNLLDKVFVGKCKFISKATEFFGGINSEDFESLVFENPTWLTIFECANESLSYTLDLHHIYFETIFKVDELENGIKVFRLFMGS